MHETAASVLAPWATYYALTGSAAAALTGVMFVVITLVTGVERVRRQPDGIATFSTPTVVHFTASLGVSALFAAPWHVLTYVAALSGLVGLYGIAYILRVMFRARRLNSYTPDLEDWAWHSAIPLAAYGAILAGAIMLLSIPQHGIYALAAGVIVLIFVGIHNAWDVVTFLAIGDDDPDTNPN